MHSGKIKAWQEARYADAKLAYNALMKFYPFTLKNLDGEIWEWISGYEGAYQESNYGRTKSFKRRNVKIMKPSLDSNGYLFVELRENNVGKKFKVQRLVAQTFLPNPDNLSEVDHRFGMKFDNSAENLRWVTKAQNNQYAFALGLHNHPKGENNHNAKLTNAEASLCRQIHIKGDKKFGSAALARKFGVSINCIQYIVKDITYKTTK